MPSRTTPPSTLCVRPDRASRRSRASAPSAALPSSRPSSTTSVSTPEHERPLARAASSPAAALRRAFSSTTSAGSPSRELLDVGHDDLELDPERRRGSRAAAATPSRISREAAPEPTLISRSGNQSAISRSADSSESEPWTRLKVTSSGEVAADRARRRLERVGRADQLARGGDRVVALEHRRDQRARR